MSVLSSPMHVLGLCQRSSQHIHCGFATKANRVPYGCGSAESIGPLHAFRVFVRQVYLQCCVSICIAIDAGEPCMIVTLSYPATVWKESLDKCLSVYDRGSFCKQLCCACEFKLAPGHKTSTKSKRNKTEGQAFCSKKKMKTSPQ